MTEERIKILVVDDNTHFLGFMQDMLESENYEVITAGDGQTALQSFKNNLPSLVLLDIMLPDMDGNTVCRQLRSFSQVPIIMISGKHSKNDKIEGLDNGADDYITKPFFPDELAARIRARIRRLPQVDDQPLKSFQCQDLNIDFGKQRVTVADELIDLTSIEYRILTYLALNLDKTISPDELLMEIWGEKNRENEHSLRVNISRLRHKLNDTGPVFRYIITIPGEGYSIHGQYLSKFPQFSNFTLIVPLLILVSTKFLPLIFDMSQICDIV
jgi:DNA-binding response OmpR family regulator